MKRIKIKKLGSIVKVKSNKSWITDLDFINDTLPRRTLMDEIKQMNKNLHISFEKAIGLNLEDIEDRLHMSKERAAHASEQMHNAVSKSLNQVKKNNLYGLGLDLTATKSIKKHFKTHKKNVQRNRHETKKT